MEALVTISKKGNPITTSLKVAEIFGKRHDHVLRDIENLSCSDTFRLLNFGETPYIHPQNGQTYSMYVMTKDGFTFLAMGFTGEKAAQFKEMYIAEFNKREMMLKSDEYILARSQEILQRKMIELESRLNQSEKLIEEQAPKVIFADAVTASTDCTLIKELAAYLKQNGVNIGQNRLFAKLREDGYLCSARGERWNMPTQKALNLNLLEVEPGVVNKAGLNPRNTLTPKVTGKGRVYFLNKYLKELSKSV